MSISTGHWKCVFLYKQYTFHVTCTVSNACLFSSIFSRKKCMLNVPPPLHNRFTVPFRGPPGWAGARRKLLLDFMVLGRITRGRYTDNVGGCHSIWTNQKSMSINPPIFLRRMPFLPQPCPIYPGLRQAQEYAGLHTQWLGYIDCTLKNTNLID